MAPCVRRPNGCPRAGSSCAAGPGWQRRASWPAGWSPQRHRPAPPSAIRPSKLPPTRAILDFALTLEYLQAAFYTEAERVGSLHGALADQARVVGSHERAHVEAFRKTLGAAAVKRPSFNFRGATDSPKSFRATAVAFEDLAVGAYRSSCRRSTQTRTSRPRLRSTRWRPVTPPGSGTWPGSCQPSMPSMDLCQTTRRSRS